MTEKKGTDFKGGPEPKDGENPGVVVLSEGTGTNVKGGIWDGHQKNKKK